MRWFIKAIPAAQHVIVLGVVVAIAAGLFFGSRLYFDERDLIDHQRDILERQEAVLDRRETQTDAEERRVEDAVDRILEEVRDPKSEAGDTREDTFRRIRRLCAVHEGCDP